MRCYCILAGIAFSVGAVLSSAAMGCSVVDDYRVPTNLELTDQSKLILLGKVVGETEGENLRDNSLLVEPVEALMGDLPAGIIKIAGSRLVVQPDDRGFGLLSNPYELEGAHPLSYIGSCTRRMFPEGTTVLFFLEGGASGWHSAGGPFSRWAEDVLVSDAPWLKLTRFYASVLDVEPGTRKAMLEAELERLLGLQGDPVAALMARDVARQLAGPNDTWNDIMRRGIEGDIPAGAASEAAANAAAAAVMVAAEALLEPISDEQWCGDSPDDDKTACSIELEAQPDEMADAVAGNW